MSRSALGVAIVLLAAALSTAAPVRSFAGRGGGGHGGGGHFGGGHFGGAHFGGGHFGGARHFGAAHASHVALAGHANFGHAAAVSHALNSHAGALRTAHVLNNPMARSRIGASLAMAGWHGHGFGWWRHFHGGFGWIGPLFWPFAYYDIYDYLIWAYGYPFWDYGYWDIYAGIFSPYGYSDLYGYMASAPDGRRHRGGASLAQVCADDSREIAGLPTDQIAQAITPTEEQRASLDDLAGSSIKAAQTIRAACPTQAALTAPGRLAAMQNRVEAMISAVELVRPPLEKLYGLLDDEQKARFNALAEEQRRKSLANTPGGSTTPGCTAAQSAAVTWPTSEIEARLHPNDTQRAALGALQDAAAHAADTLKAACEPAGKLTPVARLDAVSKRLDDMLQAIKSVRAALDDFYATLSDEQKAQFEAIGPGRTS